MQRRIVMVKQVCLCCCSLWILLAGTFSDAWEITYRRPFADVSREAVQTHDGGYLLVGLTDSSRDASDYRAWVVKVSRAGRIEWQKFLGTGVAESIANAPPDGFVVALSTAGGITVVRIAAAGNIRWQKSFLRDNSAPIRIRQAQNGGYVIAGYTDFVGNESDLWVLRLDSSGKVKWQYTYGGPYSDFPYDIRETPEGGWIVVGYVQLAQKVLLRSWVIKLRPNGQIEWQRAFGGERDTYGLGVQLTPDGGYAVAGQYFKGNATNMYLAKLDSSGWIQWAKSYGGDSYEQMVSFDSNGAGGYLLAGDSGSYTNGRRGTAWIVSVDFLGRINWQKSFARIQSSIITSVHSTKDGGVAAFGDLVRPSTGQDWWFMRLDPTGNVNARCALQQDSASFAPPVQFNEVTTSRKAVHKKMTVRAGQSTVQNADGVAQPLCSK